MRDLIARLRRADPDCACEASVEGTELVLASGDCPGRGDLAAEPHCRSAAVETLRGSDVDAIVTRAAGTDRRYVGRSAALLGAAGEFAERVAPHDADLAELATRDPLAAATAATGRAGPVAEAAYATDLAALSETATGYEDALRAFVGPTVARSRVDPTPPPAAELVATRDPGGPASVRVYERPGAELRTYHLDPVAPELSPGARATLAAAHDYLAEGRAGDGERAPRRAVRAVADGRDPVETLAAVLEKYTRGFGVLEDLFGDPEVTDVFASAPAPENDVRVVLAGETMRTNVRFTDDGAATLASQLRRASGRAFSRANPTLDAVAEGVGAADRVRAAAVAEPVAGGTGFAFRAHGGATPTLPWLVGDGCPAEAAALLSLAVERGVAALVAGTRGAGKTTLLASLLWELPAAVRVVAIEDTPELPIGALQSNGRDVQALRTDLEGDRGPDPAAALRTALRLGEGALVVGEVRGEEARVLYEAMRVGASGSAVLGTIHGDGAETVRERVVTDLGVSPGAFAATDLVVTMDAVERPDGAERRLAGVEEVRGGDDLGFASLFERRDGDLVPSGRIARGESRVVAGLAGDGETYADVRERLADRAAFLRDLSEREDTGPAAVAGAHAERRT